MPVYVDHVALSYGRMRMSHMIADTRAELLAMAERIGVPAKWLQNANTYREHFDVCLSRRGMALEFGAVPVSSRRLGELLLAKRARPAE